MTAQVVVRALALLCIQDTDNHIHGTRACYYQTAGRITVHQLHNVKVLEEWVLYDAIGLGTNRLIASWLHLQYAIALLPRGLVDFPPSHEDGCKRMPQKSTQDVGDHLMHLVSHSRFRLGTAFLLMHSTHYNVLPYCYIVQGFQECQSSSWYTVGLYR